MRNKSVLTATILTLSLSTAAWAADPVRSDRYRDRGPDRWSGGRVVSLASQLENTAASIQREFERNNRRPDREEARVAASLAELRVSADRFHREVTRNRQDTRYDERGFTEISRAFDRTASTLRYIEPRGYVDRGMDRIASLLSELDRYYGRDDRDGRDSRGRYDNYRNDRDGRYDRRN